MKKVLFLLLTAALLTGCGAQETFETVEDIIPVQPVAAKQQLFAQFPENAASAAFSNEENGELYLSDGCTITKQILPGGDLAETVMTVTGQSKDNLQIMKTRQQGADRYDFVWAAAGEDGLQLGRACILDDGDYHYVLSAMAEESVAADLQETWEDLFSTCCLLDPDVNLNTGS